jgi:GPI-anchor transamidase subunit T
MLLIFYVPEKKPPPASYTSINSVTATRHGLISRLLAKLRGQKVDPSESGSSSESTGSKKLLFKVVFVAVAAVLFHYFSNNS